MVYTTKFAALIRDILQLINEKSASSLAGAHVLGKWVWASLVCRPALSCFGNAFLFVQLTGSRVYDLWP